MSTSTTNFLSQPEIEANDPKWASIYKNMQGNILKGHGRDHATMIFLSFGQKNKTPTRKALKEFAENQVTSFYKQLWERERYKRNKVPGDIFCSLFITQKGYEYLEDETLLGDKAFIAGLKARPELNDSPVPNESGYYNTIHVMLLLADDDKDRMDIAAGKVIAEMDKVATILHVEYGDAIRNSNKDGLEHNGYVDGVSQPLFLKDEVDEYVKQHGIKRGVKSDADDGFAFNPIKTPGLVLLKDPYVKQNEGIYGSYFVFRKLEQKVKAFKKQESTIGIAMYGKKAEENERAGAMLVGRFEDGTPIQVQGEDKLIGSGAFNNFNYDPSGGACPHFAHIRKTNPRKVEGKNIYKFDDNAIARRGIPYGHRNVNTELNEIRDDQFPVDGVGLLFMSYQQSIETQFEVIQKRANFNDVSAAAKDGGVDPVIGQTPEGMKRTNYEFPKDAEQKPDAVLNHEFDQHIHFKGGEYFFAPSMAYLDKLIP